MFRATFVTGLVVLALPLDAHCSLFGEETLVLTQMLANQLKELSQLAEQAGISREQTGLLLEVNAGVDRSVRQIQSIESIVERSQGVDPTSVKSLSQINSSLEDMKELSQQVHELVAVKLELCDEAVDEASLQSDTAYKMGQEMTGVGAQLAEESKSASPGRSAQITASAASAQMLASGVQLQTLAQIAQLQAMSLDLQKSEIQRRLSEEEAKRLYIGSTLGGSKATQRVLKQNRTPLKSRSKRGAR